MPSWHISPGLELACSNGDIVLRMWPSAYNLVPASHGPVACAIFNNNTVLGRDGRVVGNMCVCATSGIYGVVPEVGKVYSISMFTKSLW